MDNAYHVRIIFIKAGAELEEKVFRCIVDRSPQGAITKAFRRSRVRKGNGNGHGNYSCERLSVEVKCLGHVDK